MGIEVGRNSIVVRDIDKKSAEYKKAQYLYSVYDNVTHSYTLSAFVEDSGNLYFPSSISVADIESVFPKEDVIVNFGTTAKAGTVNYNMKHQPKTDDDGLQISAIDFLMKMKKDPSIHQRLLSLKTGSGKTYVTINVISKLKKKAMIIVDTIQLATQWKEQFLFHTDLTEDDIVILSGQESVDKEFQKPTGKIYIAIHYTLRSMINNNISSINALSNKLGIGIRVFDEAHVCFENICKINSLSNVEYTIYLTATPSRSNFNDNSVYAKVFKKVPYFNGKEIHDNKYLTVLLWEMNSCPTLDDKTSVRTKYGFNMARWAQYIAKDGYEVYLETLIDIFEKLKLTERNKKIAIVLPTIELIMKTKTDLERLFPDKFSIGTFIGDVAKTKREEELTKNIILTNNKIFGKAIDVKDLEILINFVPFGSSVETEQVAGRLRDREGYSSILIDVTDTGFDECVRHGKVRKRFYKKNAKKILEDIKK